MDGWVNRKSNSLEKQHREEGEAWLSHWDVAGECQLNAMEPDECDHSGKSPDTGAGFGHVLLKS